jgi:hypothetical protein
MKNIHLIATDKPSRLLLSKRDYYQFLKDNASTNINNHFEGNYQHIYITSDEKPKEGDWYFDGTDLVHKKTKYNDSLVDGNKQAKKIILTTDQDLIGVQAIDDEFLEWFVKNPSCESVEVFKERYHGVEFIDDYPKGFFDYKIIIPQVEPNPFELPKALPDDVFYQSLEEPKQETLEEVLKLLHDKWNLTDSLTTTGKNLVADTINALSIIEQDQDKNKYSEEEVKQIIFKFTNDFDMKKNIEITSEEQSKWFEQFRKN